MFPKSISHMNSDTMVSLTIDDGGSSLTIDGAVEQEGEWVVGQSGDWKVAITGGSLANSNLMRI